MKKMKVILILLPAAFFLLGCPNFAELAREVVKPPKVSVKDVVITDISTEKIGFNLELAIDNPNPIGLPLTGIEYRFNLMDQPLFSGKDNSSTEIKASGVSQVNIPVSVAYADIKTIYDSARGLDEMPYTFSGKVHLETPVSDLPVPFKTSGKLPVIRPPKIKNATVNVERLGFTGIDLSLVLTLHNPNGFDLQIVSLKHSMKLDGHPFVSGSIPARTIPRKSSGTLRIPVKIDSSKLAIFRSIIKKGSASYSLDYNATYNLKDRTIKHSDNFQGKVDFRR